MAGIKGKSGRKGWKEEIEAKEVTQLAVNVVKKGLMSDELSLEKKVDIALPWALKAIYGKKDTEGLGMIEVSKIYALLISEKQVKNSQIIDTPQDMVENNVDET